MILERDTNNMYSPIARCPNPECRSDCVAQPVSDWPVCDYRVCCSNCGYEGPNGAGETAAESEIEAIRLHNLIAEKLANQHQDSCRAGEFTRSLDENGEAEVYPCTCKPDYFSDEFTENVTAAFERGVQEAIKQKENKE
jgi:hypothetical protein